MIGLGPTVRWPLSARWMFGLGVRASALFHTYRLDDTSGIRVDAVFDLPLVVQWRLQSDLAVEATVAPGLAAQARRHLRDDETLWQRGALRLGGGLGLTWQVGL